MAQPGLHSMMMAISMKDKKMGRKRKRKKSTMAGGVCATISPSDVEFGEESGVFHVID